MFQQPLVIFLLDFFIVSLDGSEDFLRSRRNGHMIIAIDTNNTAPIIIGLSMNAMTGNLFIYYKYLNVLKGQLNYPIKNKVIQERN